MNAKYFSAVLLFSALIISLFAGISLVKASSDDQISFSFGVTLFSPLNQTYNSRFLQLNYSFTCGLGVQYSLSYDIDGKYSGPMPYIVEKANEMHVVYHATGLVTLPELSEGSHSLTVNLLTSQNNNHIKPSYSDKVYFSIDVDVTPPNVSVLSPINKTYIVSNITEAQIPLDFVINETVKQLSYNLDGQNETVIGGNTTLTGLSFGTYCLTVKAVDLAGNIGYSDIVNFTVAEEVEIQREPESFPTTLVLTASGTSVAFAVVVCAGLLIYFKKHKLQDTLMH